MKIDEGLWTFWSLVERLYEKYRIINSIPGVGPITAATLVTAMPELGGLSGKQIASLAGLAPHVNDSGKYKGRATSCGPGRPGRYETDPIRDVHQPCLIPPASSRLGGTDGAYAQTR